MPAVRTIGICTGGGDAPGLNAVIRAAVKCAILKYQWKVIGIPDGFDGLIWPEKSFELTLKDVSGILPRGGTILGTTNRGNPFLYQVLESGKEVTKDRSTDVIRNAERMGIDGVIVIGGDGSQKIALELYDKGMKVVGVPKTIDNDLCATDVTFGFDTALNTATDAVDKIHTTAESHHRIMLVEVMGRDAGWHRGRGACDPHSGDSVRRAKSLRLCPPTGALWKEVHDCGCGRRREAAGGIVPSGRPGAAPVPPLW
jgi:6-phosphofructokinase 1